MKDRPFRLIELLATVPGTEKNLDVSWAVSLRMFPLP